MENLVNPQDVISISLVHAKEYLRYIPEKMKSPTPAKLYSRLEQSGEGQSVSRVRKDHHTLCR